MSTVLTNGIIIPDNGNRNWGGDLANNWNILDVNVGYMTDVKNKVTTLENSTAENTANIQTNASNISALQTSKQDVIEDLETIRTGANAGATAVQPSTLNNYLPSSGGPITGNLVVNSTSDGWKPGLEWLYNNERYAYIHAFTNETRSEKSLSIQADTHINLASQNLIFSVSRTVSDNTYQNALNFQCETNGTFNFYSNAPVNLGTSTNKWKDIYATSFNGNFYGAISKLISGDVYRDVDNSYVAIGGGSKYATGSTLILGGASNNNYAGQAIITAKDSSTMYELKVKCTDTALLKNGVLSWSGTVIHALDNACDLGNSTKRFKDIYATNSTINTSDRNAKTSIKNIDDKLLAAWDNVSLVSFKFKDAVEKKGDGARIHMGYIAQDIKEELSKHDIDACDFGLFCYNSWDAQEEKSHEEERTDEDGNIETVKVIDTPALCAGETFGLRYIECLVVECAYLRKKNKELEDRITKLEKNLTI